MSDEFAEARERFSTVRDWLRFAVSRFNAAQLHFGHGTSDAYDEAAYLILHTLALPLDRLEPFLDARLTAGETERIVAVLRQRIEKRIPAAYLTNEAWLGEYRFYVDRRAIVPRSFIAEALADRLEPWLEGRVDNVLDLCTGSGCLAILAALAFPDARVVAADVSADALEVARRNVADYRLQERIAIVQSNLFESLHGHRFDLILCNPPYVTAEAMRALPPEYGHEPALALAGGEDGLAIVRSLLNEAADHLSEHGVLVVEVGHNRDALERAFPDLPFQWLETSAGSDFVFALSARDLRPHDQET